MTDKTIIFDLDGTLVETAPDLTNTLNHILETSGFPPISIETLRPMIGQGARKMIERGFAHYDQDLPEQELDSLVAVFLDHYSQYISVHSHPFPSVERQLDALKDDGAILAVCTNKSEKLARALLADLSLDKYFAAILGGDSLPVRKPDPIHLVETIKQAGGAPERAIMVGDSATDIRAAQAAKVPVIAVTFGYTMPGFDGTTPDVTIDHYDELTIAIDKLLAEKTSPV